MMPHSTVDHDPLSRLEEMITLARPGVRRHRLILVVGPSGSGKTRLLREKAKELQAPYYNVNLEVSRALREEPAIRHPRVAGRIVERLVLDTLSDVIFLDNIEMLFERSFRLDPLRLLENLSRTRLLVVAWNGRLEGSRQTIVYAEPDHPDYRRYPEMDALIIDLSQTTRGAAG